MEGNCEKDSSPIGKFPSVVTTLYHAHNSNVFKSSESSVQITSAVNGHGNAFSGSSKTSQNFCELDIVSRREREKSGDVSRSGGYLVEESRNLQLNSLHKAGVFRKKLFDRQVKEDKSGILCLANVVKDVDEEYCKPIISRTKDKDDKLKSPVPMLNLIPGDGDPKQKQLNDFLKCKEYGDGRRKSNEDGKVEMDNPEQLYQMNSQKPKKSRSVSRRRRAKDRSPASKSVDQKPRNKSSNETRTDNPESLEEPSFEPQTESSKKIPMKFVDLAQARAMYFVELPNQSPFQVIKKKSIKNKHKKDSESLNNPNVIEREDPKLGHIIINKIDDEYPTASSLDTESSVPIKLRSEISLSSLAATKKKQKKQHTNSPQPAETPREPKAKESTKTKGKHKKKHRTSPRGSYANDVIVSHMRQEAVNLNYDFVPCKEEKKPEKEVEILYKKKVQRRTSGSNMGRSPSKRNDPERKSNKHTSKSPVKEGKLHDKKDKSPVKEKKAKEKTKKEKSPKQEKKDDKKRRASTANRRVHSANRETKVDAKRDGSPKNVKMKDPSHRSNRKVSPIHLKGGDAEKFEFQKFRRRPSPNQIQQDWYELSKKQQQQRDNNILTQSILKRSSEPKERKEHIDSRNTHVSRSYPQETRITSHQPMPKLGEAMFAPLALTRKQRKDVDDEQKVMVTTPSETVEVKFSTPQQFKIDSKDIQTLKKDDNAVLNIFITDNKLKSDSCLIVPEQELSSLMYAKSKLMAEKTHSKGTKPKISVKTVGSTDWSMAIRKKNSKKKQKGKSQNSKRKLSKTKDSVNRSHHTAFVDASVNAIRDYIPLNMSYPNSMPEEKAMQTSLHPLVTKSQCVGVGLAVNHYMGYFVPPQVAERFSRKYTTPHSVVPELLKPVERNQQPIVINSHPKIKRSRSCVPTKFTDTTIDDPEISPSKSQILNSKRLSDTQLTAKLPKKMRSKSVITKDDPPEIDKSSLDTIESREHLQRELKKLQVFQQNDTRKRLRVVSKTIDRNDYELFQNPESELGKVTGSNRLKPHLPSKEEQDAILNLPICQNDSRSSTNSLTSSDLSAGIKVNTVLKLQSRYPNAEEEPCHPDEPKKLMKGNQNVTRREVSFSQLNTKPQRELYSSPRSDKYELFDLSGEDRKVQSKSTVFSDLASEPTDGSLEYKENERKLQSVHMIVGEKVTEIYNKAIGNDGKVIEGYTVSGIEPPKKLRCGGRNAANIKYSSKTDKLHLMFFPPTQIMNYMIQPKESYAYGIFIQPAAVKEMNYFDDQSEKSTLSSDVTEKSIKKNLKSDNMRSPIQVKTKRKLLLFESTKKKNKGLSAKRTGDLKHCKKTEGTDTGKSLGNKVGKSISSLLLEVSSSDEKLQSPRNEPAVESPCKKQQKKRSPPRQEIRSLSRISSAVKMMESSLQIIKEESQSTDSSVKKVTEKKKKISVTDIKQTQTELVTNDMDKMKEVISYLYMAFDHNTPRAVGDCFQNPRDIITKMEAKQDNHSSSTESTSCCEQFKNMVKNVKPKFGTLKRLSKSELSQKPSITSKCNILEGEIDPTSQLHQDAKPIIQQAGDTCAFICVNLQDSSTTLIPAERLYSSSDTKFFKHQSTTELSTSKKRTSSIEYIRPDYSHTQKYISTKDLLNTLRTSKSIHADPEKHDKAICTDSKPDIKSSTSISDFSSVVISVADIEKERLQQEITQAQSSFLKTKTNEEKSVQCALTDNGNCKSATMTLSHISRPIKSNAICMQCENFMDNIISCNIPNDKAFENKSLQTSAAIADPQLMAKLERALPQVPCTMFAYSKNDKDTTFGDVPFCGLARKVSSQTFGSPRCVKHRRKPESGSLQDSLTGRKMNTKAYKNKREQEKSLHLSRRERSHKSEGRKIHGKKTVEIDYVNLLKLEKHLEQVLGLYPTVCKAIRAHMANNLTTPTKTTVKDRKKIIFASQDTLATTVDTITEYNVMDTDENVSMSTQSRRGHRNLKFPLNKYLYENHFKFQKPTNAKKNKSKSSVFPFSGKSSSKNVDLIELSTPYPYTDSSSSSSKGREYRMIQYRKDRKASRWNLRKGRKQKKGNFNFYRGMFSDDVRDNWSIGSPLYSISTPSLTFSKNEMMGKTKSKSLTTTQILTSQVSTTQSLIEVSSNKNINRRAMIQHLKEDLFNGSKGKAFRLGTQQVFVLSLDSAKQLSNAPPKLLAKVEQRRQHDQSDYTASKLTEISEPKIKVDETNCYDLLFAEGGKAKRKNRNNSAAEQDRPFYIHHQQSSTGSSDLEYFDSIEKMRRISEQEDLGNFSADSLDSTTMPGDDAFNYTMDLLQNNLMPPKQNFIVYTSTVKYSPNPLNKQSNNVKTSPIGSRPSSRPSSEKSSRKGFSSKPNPSKPCSLKRFLSPPHKSPPPTQPVQRETGINTEKGNVGQTETAPQKTTDDSSNTIISESGYETSNKTKSSASIKNFFKKGGSLLDIFRHTAKSKATGQAEGVQETSSGTNLTSFCNMSSKHNDNQPDASLVSTDRQFHEDQDEVQTTAPASGAKIFWSNLARKKSFEKNKITFKGCPRPTSPKCQEKGTSTRANKKCSVDTAKNFEKEMCACHEYAEKVVHEAQMRKEGHQKQYKDFEEIPLELLIGRKVPMAFRKGPPIVQMNVVTDTGGSVPGKNPCKYPFFDSKHVLDEKQPFVTYVEDKIVFKSSQSNIRKAGYRSKPTSPSRELQGKALKPRGSIHDIFYRTKVFKKKDSDNTHDCPPMCKCKRKKSGSVNAKDFESQSKKFDKISKLPEVFWKKVHKSPKDSQYDTEDESFDTTATVPMETISPSSAKTDADEMSETEIISQPENQPPEVKSIKFPNELLPIASPKDMRAAPKIISPGRKSCFRRREAEVETDPVVRTKSTDPFAKLGLPGFKTDRTMETEIEEAKSNATGPLLEIHDIKTRGMRTKETHMDIKPWHKTVATEPMPAERITTKVQETFTEHPIRTISSRKRLDDGSGTEESEAEESTTQLEQTPPLSHREWAKKPITSSPITSTPMRASRKIHTGTGSDMDIIETEDSTPSTPSVIIQSYKHKTLEPARRKGIEWTMEDRSLWEQPKNAEMVLREHGYKGSFDDKLREGEMIPQVWETTEKRPFSPQSVYKHSAIRAPEKIDTIPPKTKRFTNEIETQTHEINEMESWGAPVSKPFLHYEPIVHQPPGGNYGKVDTERHGYHQSHMIPMSPRQRDREKYTMKAKEAEMAKARQEAENAFVMKNDRKDVNAMWKVPTEKNSPVVKRPPHLHKDGNRQPVYKRPLYKADILIEAKQCDMAVQTWTTSDEMEHHVRNSPTYKRTPMWHPPRLTGRLMEMTNEAYEPPLRTDDPSEKLFQRTKQTQSEEVGNSMLQSPNSKNVQYFRQKSTLPGMQMHAQSAVYYTALKTDSGTGSDMFVQVWKDKNNLPTIKPFVQKSVQQPVTEKQPKIVREEGVQVKECINPDPSWVCTATRTPAYEPTELKSDYQKMPSPDRDLLAPNSKSPGKTVHTQIEQEPIQYGGIYQIPEIVLAPRETSPPHHEPPIETIFQQRTDQKQTLRSAMEPHISDKHHDQVQPQSITAQRTNAQITSKKPVKPKTAMTSQTKQIITTFSDEPVEVGKTLSEYIGLHQKQVKGIKVKPQQSLTMLQTEVSETVFLLPQDEVDAEIISLTENRSKFRGQSSLSITDSLLLLHKSFENAKIKKPQNDEELDGTRHTSVIIINTPVIIEGQEATETVRTSTPFLDKMDGRTTKESDQSLGLDVENPSTHSCASFVERVIDEIINSVVDESDLKYASFVKPQEESKGQMEAEVLSFEETRASLGGELPDIAPEDAKQQTSEDFRKGLTDKEVFDKLLSTFEKEDEIAVRLSKDEEFFQEQIKTLRKESDESLLEDIEKLAEQHNILSEDTIGDKHRSTHFWEEKMKAMKAKEENPVKTDDIGTCFARGFRPDNIALSGDACFNLNKQDKLKFTKGMLTDEESIIDFSERETPLDYLLALGFMVDEASNALKDDDIRSRLLAAITEARVWINKITTTQGTLLYLVAYKSRPKTMRYFLQLVEAIINKRINNAIKLDGFLRVLEKVEEGEIQMINILGADKFEDEENEEKIVKKQLRQLFITVYKIAEKEAQQKGNQLSPQAIVLLRILAAKYRAGLHPHLELIARYIGQDLLNTETQLEAAMIFLSRLDTAEVKLKEFEAYCDIKCEKKKQKQKPTDASLEEPTSEKIVKKDVPQEADLQVEGSVQQQEPEQKQEEAKQKNSGKEKGGTKKTKSKLSSITTEAQAKSD